MGLLCRFCKENDTARCTHLDGRLHRRAFIACYWYHYSVLFSFLRTSLVSHPAFGLLRLRLEFSGNTRGITAATLSPQKCRN
ncbi:hypothetical protein GGI43DRAFT_392108 [Trichoderma evansii]